MKIDTHQHFWRYDHGEYGWIGPHMDCLKRDYLPDDLAPLLSSEGMDGTIAVQARQCIEESRWLLELSERHSFIRGVVGWVDLCSNQVKGQLEKLVGHRKFCGVRHVIHDELDDEFMLRADFMQGVSLLGGFELTYDILIFPKHLPAACTLAAHFPDQPFVVDHLAKPAIRKRQLEPWKGDLNRLASLENVHCKLSGMVTEADWTNWKPTDFTVYLDTVFECFGSSRVMVGSDWPVCNVAGSYTQVMGIIESYVEKFSDDEKSDIWGENARRFYGFPG